MSKPDPYEGISLRRVPPPRTLAVGGWWRARWRFRSVGMPLQSFPVPPPWGDVDTTSLFVSCWRNNGEKLVVDVFSRDETVSAESLTCVSVIAAWLKRKAGGNDIEVDGIRGRPVVKLSRLEPGHIEEMESLGY